MPANSSWDLIQDLNDGPPTIFITFQFKLSFVDTYSLPAGAVIHTQNEYKKAIMVDSCDYFLTANLK